MLAHRRHDSASKWAKCSIGVALRGRGAALVRSLATNVLERGDHCPAVVLPSRGMELVLSVRRCFAWRGGCLRGPR